MKQYALSIVFFILSLLGASFIYWPLMHGMPIWDDLPYWFFDNVMFSNFSYLEVWKNFVWPLSVTVQKALLQIFHYRFFNYHLFNLILHFINAGLVYLLGKKLHLRHSKLFFLAFLLHPACVISVGWMIQMKTLLCMLLFFLSLLSALQVERDKRWIIPTGLFFILSILAKSASLPGIVIILWVLRKNFTKAALAVVLPVILLASGYFGYKMISSANTKAGITRAQEINQMQDSEALSLVGLNVDGKIVLKTLHYYFWQNLLPTNTTPVKGPLGNSYEIWDFLHIFFLLSLCLLFWKQDVFPYLVAAHLLILPFVGLITAPFMSVTWVSDQHLYLVIPFFMLFWFKVLERTPVRIARSIIAIFLCYFTYKTYQTTPYYQNEIVFYRKCLEHNPLNVAITVNLANAYWEANRHADGIRVLEDLETFSLLHPEIKKSPYWHHVPELKHQIREKQ